MALNRINKRMLDKDFVKEVEDHGKELEKVNADLAQTSNHAGSAFSKNTVINPTTQHRPLMTIIDDDARLAVWDKIKPVVETKGVPITIAVPVKNRETGGTQELSKEQLLELQEMGCEMANHSYTHPDLSLMSYEELETELYDSNVILKSWGLDVKNFVAPYGSNRGDKVREVSSKYFNCGASTSLGVNTRPVQNQFLKRIPFGSMTRDGENTLEFYKSKIDEAIANNGWVIFMSHCWHPDHDATQQQYLIDIIEYAQSKDVDIVNLNDGFKEFGNVVEVENVMSVDFKGDIHSRQFEGMKTVLTEGLEVGSSTLPDYFKSNYAEKMVFSYFGFADNQTFPVLNAGLLTTYVISNKDEIWQEWRPYRRNQTFKRFGNADNTWSAWDESLLRSEFQSEMESRIDTTIKKTINAYNGNSLITEFPDKKITVFHVNTVAGAGFPDGASGTCTTYRIGGAGWDYQVFKRYNNQNMYYRHVKTDGTWDSWKLVSVTTI